MTDLNPSLKSRVLAGSIWTLSGYTSSQIIRLATHLLLAWLLTPQIFGLMALVKVVQVGLVMFSDVGIQPSIIQNKRGPEPKFLNTAWTIQIIRGIVLWLCACILSWPFAAFFARNDSAAWQLVHLLPIAGLGAVLEGFNSTALATLNRNLQLGRVTMLELGKQVVSISVMVTWALLSPTVWALVVGGLAGSAFKMGASHFIVPGYRVKLGWDRQCAHELFRFGRWIFLSTAFSFLAVNLDKLILGYIRELEDLGRYSIALVFAKVAQYVGMRLTSTVLFPVFTKYQDDPYRMVDIALRARRLVLWVGLAVCSSFAIGSPLFFDTLWDPRYHQAGYYAQWLSIYIWTMILMLTMSRIPLALGNSRALFIGNIWQCTGSMIAIVGYMAAGLPGFICGLSLGPVLSHFYLLRHVPNQRIEFLLQGGRFTFWVFTYGLPSVLLCRSLKDSKGGLFYIIVVVALSASPLLLATLKVWQEFQRKGKKEAH